MMSIANLLMIADAYKSAAGIQNDTTVSNRVFGDSKKLGALRRGSADITVSRFNAALAWFAAHWPDGSVRPSELPTPTPTREDDAA